MLGNEECEIWAVKCDVRCGGCYIGLNAACLGVTCEFPFFNCLDTTISTTVKEFISQNMHGRSCALNPILGKRELSGNGVH